jgi:spermidine/putrescine transport system substrate-binding protein
LAEAFIDYFHRPEVAALFVNDSGFNTPNRYDPKDIEPWLLRNPAVFPNAAALVHCEFMRDIGSTAQLYDQYWSEIKAR